MDEREREIEHMFGGKEESIELDMDLYALIDEEDKVVRQRGKGKMGIFSDLGLLKQHAWRYGEYGVEYKVVSLAPTEYVKCNYIKEEDL